MDDGALDDLPKSLYLEVALYNDADYGYEVVEDAEELQWFAEKLQGLISGDDWDLNDFLARRMKTLGTMWGSCGEGLHSQKHQGRDCIRSHP